MDHIKEPFVLAILVGNGIPEEAILECKHISTIEEDGFIKFNVEWIPKEPVEKFYFKDIILNDFKIENDDKE